MTQAKRDNKGKPKLSMLPKEPLVQITRVLEFGEAKYDRNNWRKGLPYTSVIDSALRHLHSFLEGEDTDHESGISHIAHAATNMVFLLQYLKDHPEMDDRALKSEEEDPAIYEREIAKMRAESLYKETGFESLEKRLENEQTELRKSFDVFINSEGKTVGPKVTKVRYIP